MVMTNAIEAVNLGKTYRVPRKNRRLSASLLAMFTNRYDTVAALSDVTFSVAPGELIGYVGANGAGKSTTFKLLCGILAPSQGSVQVDGLSPVAQRVTLAKRLGVVFGHRSQLWWDLPLADSFEILGAMYDVPRDVFKQNLAHAITELELIEFLGTPVRHLSLGQRMRGELAAAFIHNPKIALLDEPLIGLDVLSKDRVKSFIAAHREAHGTTIVLASHDMADVEQLCDRMLLVDHGRIAYDGRIEAFKTHHAPFRTLRVTFAQYYPCFEDLEAELMNRHATVAEFRIASDTNPIRVMSRLGAKYAIRDIAINDPSLEEILRSMFATSRGKPE